MSNPFRYGEGVEVPMVEMNVRKMLPSDPRRAHVLSAIEADIDRQVARNFAAPLKLSPLALATFSMKPKSEPHEDADAPLPEAAE